MSEEPKRIWKQKWKGPRGLVAWFLILAIASFIIVYCLELINPRISQRPFTVALIFSIVTAAAALLLFTLARWLFSHRNRRRVLFGVACLITLIALFYAEENWRGKKAWENYKREAESKGVILDWDRFVPPPVPDELNIFKAPKMQEWFAGRGERELSKRLKFLDRSDAEMPTDSKVAAQYLADTDQLESDFDLIRAALKRPYSRMDGNYQEPIDQPVPNFVVSRSVAQVLSERTKCFLLLGEPEKAMRDLTLLHEMSRLLQVKPNGRPITLVAAMVNVSITERYTRTVAESLRLHAWHDPQLATLEDQLREIDLPPLVSEAFKTERAGISRIFSSTPLRKIVSFENPKNFWEKLGAYKYSLVPRGWIYQNMLVAARLKELPIQSLDLVNRQISPELLKKSSQDSDKTFERRSPYTFMAEIVTPSFTRAVQKLAFVQTHANQARIGCALERYRLAHGNYPETLDALAPEFLKTIPHDIIGGQPLKYRRADDGQFILYSVGWNETDDGGTVAFSKGKTPNVDIRNGDWVWKYPAE